MTLRQMNDRGERLRDSSWSQGPNASPKDPAQRFANGYVAVPLVEQIRSWNLIVTTEWWNRRIYDSCVQTELLPVGSIVVSDLALGVAGSDLRWEFNGQTILLNPTNEFVRKIPIHVTYQVRSETRHDQGKVSITITDITDPQQGKRVMQVSFDDVIREGIHFTERELDISRLKSGHYQMELQVADTQGGGGSVRMATFTIK